MNQQLHPIPNDSDEAQTCEQQLPNEEPAQVYPLEPPQVASFDTRWESTPNGASARRSRVKERMTDDVYVSRQEYQKNGRVATCPSKESVVFQLLSNVVWAGLDFIHAWHLMLPIVHIDPESGNCAP